MTYFRYETADAPNGSEELLLNIKNLFEQNFRVLQKARNEIRVIRYQGRDLVLKSFKVPSPVNRFAYSFLRDSKAKRSFTNAVTLKSLGIPTPDPLGYIEFFQGRLMRESFYVSAYSDSDFTIRKVLLDKEIKDRGRLLKAFAAFTFRLHKKNILHLDYSPGNILVSRNGSGWNFELVDINRMKFRELTYEERLKNFIKLWADDDTMRTLIREYAAFSGDNPNNSVQDALKWLHNYKMRINFKKKLKKLLR
ncbi:hypothetical protein EP073_05840 [Geovibrio thiophilus]|uniref:Protein kinase domain-containing protein n=1 Tax=Geovibrio thiophilus TaxID=139438 RepID=A0A3R5V0Z3_9BACT|nr:lipopolysaccharide kinase InaA family protein [Geovibrio thiophilus]QAR32944.1 hypothetical protein EP073_05840 [Geovibrio thiophilus]